MAIPIPARVEPSCPITPTTPLAIPADSEGTISRIAMPMRFLGPLIAATIKKKAKAKIGKEDSISEIAVGSERSESGRQREKRKQKRSREPSK